MIISTINSTRRDFEIDALKIQKKSLRTKSYFLLCNDFQKKINFKMLFYLLFLEYFESQKL